MEFPERGIIIIFIPKSCYTETIKESAGPLGGQPSCIQWTWLTDAADDEASLSATNCCIVCIWFQKELSTSSKENNSERSK